ncbi:MAG TPA: hypothetical protein PLW44_06235 [Chitinophagales bacterium]|nr:hypothetical protein [Chitinophagales bacterium]
MFDPTLAIYLSLAFIISSSVFIAIYKPRLRKLVLLTNISLILLLFTLTAYLKYANKCDENIEEWITDAPDALTDFIAVKTELDTAAHFKQEFGDIYGGLFLRQGYYEYYYSKYNMPKLAHWFKKGRDYISISPNGYTSMCYKDCTDRTHTAWGFIYNRKQNPNSTHHYKDGVIMIDSLNLNEDWYALVIKCDGCNE